MNQNLTKLGSQLREIDSKFAGGPAQSRIDHSGKISLGGIDYRSHQAGGITNVEDESVERSCQERSVVEK